MADETFLTHLEGYHYVLVCGDSLFGLSFGDALRLAKEGVTYRPRRVLDEETAAEITRRHETLLIAASV